MEIVVPHHHKAHPKLRELRHLQQRHQYHLQARGIGVIQRMPQDGHVGLHQPLVMVGIADQEVTAAGAFPLVRTQPYPGRAGVT